MAFNPATPNAGVDVADGEARARLLPELLEGGGGRTAAVDSSPPLLAGGPKTSDGKTILGMLVADTVEVGSKAVAVTGSERLNVKSCGAVTLWMERVGSNS